MMVVPIQYLSDQQKSLGRKIGMSLCSATYEHINDPKKHIDLTFYDTDSAPKVLLDYYAYNWAKYYPLIE